MSKQEADKRYEDRTVTYLFGYGDRNEVIDGFGAAMFMNHCCEPNCETEEEEERIFVVALRDIAVGEELVYEYNLWDSPATQIRTASAASLHVVGPCFRVAGSRATQGKGEAPLLSSAASRMVWGAALLWLTRFLPGNIGRNALRTSSDRITSQ